MNKASKKRKPYLVNVEFEAEAEVLAFATSETEAKEIVDVDICGLDVDCRTRAKLIRKIENIPKDIVGENGSVDYSLIFGLEKGETIFDVLEELAEKEKSRRLDEQHYHFDFWERGEK